MLVSDRALRRSCSRQRRAWDPPHLTVVTATATSGDAAGMHDLLDVPAEMGDSLAAQPLGLPLFETDITAQGSDGRAAVGGAVAVSSERRQVLRNGLDGGGEVIHARRVGRPTDGLTGEGGDPPLPLLGTGERSASNHAHTFRAGCGRDR
jgi:hypothetical protein